MSAQKTVEGKIFDSSDKDEIGLPGASIIWAGTTTGTTTNAAGYFELKRVKQTNKLVISFIGYKRDTIDIGSADDYLKHPLQQQNETGEVLVYEIGRASCREIV